MSIESYPLKLAFVLIPLFGLTSVHCSGQTDTIPFELTNHNNIAIQAVLNKVDTVTLMLHTAGVSVSLTTAGLEGVNSIKWDSEQGVESWGGASERKHSAMNSIEFGTRIIDSLGVWESTNSGPGTQGKIGLDLFQGQPVEINFSDKYLVVHRTMPPIPEEYVKQELIYKDGMVFIKGNCTIGEERFENEFMVHSGYGGAILLDDAFVLETQLGSKIEITSQQELRDSYDHIVLIKKGSLPKFETGGVVFENIPVGFFEGAIGRQQVSLLGGDMLKRFDMIFDSNRSFIYLKPNSISTADFTVFK